VQLTVVPELIYDALFAGDLLHVDVTGILNTTLTETAGGYLAAAFKKLFDVVTPVFTAACVNQAADSNVLLADGTNGVAAIKTAVGLATTALGTSGAGLTAIPTVAAVTTVGSVTTKTGYALTGDYDAAKTAATATNLGNLITTVGTAGAGLTAIPTVAAVTTVGSVTTKTGYELAANQHVIVDSGSVTVSDKTGFSGSMTVSDKTGFSISGTKQTLDALNDATQLVQRGEPPAASDIKTAIEAAGSSIALIKAKTDSLTFTITNQVDANALSGGGAGATPESIWTYPTASMGATTEIGGLFKRFLTIGRVGEP
jgi:hypothetical protein